MRGGSLLKNLAPTPKTAKRARDPKFKHDDYVTPEDAEVHFRETIQTQFDINSFSSLGSGKPRSKQQYHTDSNTANHRLSSNSSVESKPFNSNSSQDQYPTLSSLGSGDRSNDQAFQKQNFEPNENDSPFPDFLRKDINIIPPAQSRQDHQNQTKSKVIPPAFHFPQQGQKKSPPSSTSKPIVPPSQPQNDQTSPMSSTNPAISSNTSKSSKSSNSGNEIIEPEKVQPPVQDEFEYDDLVQKMSEPIRRRLVVNLPMNDFQARQIQANAALDLIEKNVQEISQNVNDTNNALIQLTHKSRSISEKSMDLSQTTEAVVSKVNVMADWIDGLEKVGSGLKIQFIEWLVKFVSFLWSLLLLFYQTLRKANPARLWRKKTETFIRNRGEDNEEEEDD
ncbi:hypothetical protein TRFO_09223 [Tritrichomonas foetus]|uniref:Uncharacterized protein n=1 Tax=Tritrichomonas foetus TaxID=1144522 RepID=A0A1J4JJS5_9EUKA|nr:hypothetical protein TRFO_09223 [Tritrichomonas foetus]|eukprot:OHS97805.1 hypothetical protein TRFO_09223 [Tritrichomonas foetus]